MSAARQGESDDARLAGVNQHLMACGHSWPSGDEEYQQALEDANRHIRYLLDLVAALRTPPSAETARLINFAKAQAEKARAHQAWRVSDAATWRGSTEEDHEEGRKLAEKTSGRTMRKHTAAERERIAAGDDRIAATAAEEAETFDAIVATLAQRDRDWAADAVALREACAQVADAEYRRASEAGDASDGQPDSVWSSPADKSTVVATFAHIAHTAHDIAERIRALPLGSVRQPERPDDDAATETMK